jgi:hypothetical protein
MKNSTIYKPKFILTVYLLCSKTLQILCNRFSQWRKLVTQSFALFWKQKVYNLNKL